MKQSIALILLISYLFSNCQSSQSSLQVIKLIDGIFQVNSQNYININETRGSHNQDQKLTVFGWFKLTQFQNYVNPLLKLSFPAQKNISQKGLENLALVNYDSIQQKIHLSYLYGKKERKFQSFKFYVARDDWIFLSLGFDFGNKKIQLFASQQNPSFESSIWKVLDLDLDIFIPNQFELNIGCFPKDNQFLAQTTTACSTGQVKNISYFEDYFINPSLMFMLDDDKLLVNNYVFDGQSYKNKVVYPKNQLANPMTLTGEKQFLNLGSTKIQVFSGQNQLNAKGLILTDQKVSQLSTFSIYMKMNFNNPTEEMNLMKLFFTDGNDLVVRIKQGAKNQYYLDFSIEQKGFQFSTGDFMQEKKVSKFTLTFIREKDQFWIMFNEFSQKIISQKIKIDNAFSTQFQLLDSSFNNPETIFKFMRIATTNQSSGVAVNFVEQQNKKSNCQLELSTSKNEDRCLTCKEKYVMISQTSVCQRHCPFGFQNIGGVCYQCTDKLCNKVRKKYFDIKKISQSSFILTLQRNILLRNIKPLSLFYVQVNGEQYATDYVYNKKILTFEPFRIQYDFIFKDLDKNHRVTFKLRNEKIHSNNLNAIPRQFSTFDTNSTQQDPIKEEFLYVNNEQQNLNKFSFLKRPVKQKPKQTQVQQKSLDDQLNDEIYRANQYLLQQKLERMSQNPGIIPMELPKTDENNYVGQYPVDVSQNYLPLQQRLNSNKIKQSQPIQIQRQNEFDLENFKQTEKELPFVLKQNQQETQDFYEQRQNLPKITNKEDPIQYQFQNQREYFYPLNQRINKQNDLEVISIQPQEQQDNIFYPRSNQLSDVMMKKIKQDKQERSNSLFFFPVEDRLQNDKQFLKNFPLLEQNRQGYQNSMNVQRTGLNMLKQHDQRKNDKQQLIQQFQNYRIKQNNQIQEQTNYSDFNEIQQQKRQQKILNNVFEMHEQNRQQQIQEQQRQQQLLNDVFEMHEQNQQEKIQKQKRQDQVLNKVFEMHEENQQQKIQKQQDQAEKQTQFLQNLFDIYNLENQQEDFQQSQKTEQKNKIQTSDDQQYDQYILFDHPNITFNVNDQYSDLNLKSSVPLQQQDVKLAQQNQNQESHQKTKLNDGKQNKLEITFLFALVVYVVLLASILIGIFKFFVNVYNKQQYSIVTLTKLTQMILSLQLFSFWSYLFDQNPKYLQSFLYHLQDLFLNTQKIFVISEPNSNKESYNLFKSHDVLQQNNVSNLFLENFSLMLVILFGLCLLYLILQFVSNRQQKQAMDNYIQQGHYKLKSSYYKLALLLEQFNKKIHPFLYIAFSFEISSYSTYNLLYAKSWRGYHLMSFLISIAVSILTLIHLIPKNCKKQSKSKKLKRKFKNNNQQECKYENDQMKKLKIIGIVFFLMGILTIILQKNTKVVIICQFFLVTCLLIVAKFKNQKKYFNLEQIVTFSTLSLICLGQLLILFLKDLKNLQYAIIALVVLSIIEGFVVVLYDLFKNEHNVVVDIQIQDEGEEEKNEDIEQIQCLKKERNDKEENQNEFKTLSEQIY